MRHTDLDKHADEQLRKGDIDHVKLSHTIACDKLAKQSKEQNVKPKLATQRRTIHDNTTQYNTSQQNTTQMN